LLYLYTNNKYSIKIEFDEQGAKNLIEGLKNALKNDRSILKVTNIEEGKVIDLTFVKNDVTNNILFSQKELVIEMDIDEIEYAIERFYQSINNKTFFPAEVCEGIHNRKNITVYAKYID
jgi:hypothetical protein